MSRPSLSSLVTAGLSASIGACTTTTTKTITEATPAQLASCEGPGGLGAVYVVGGNFEPANVYTLITPDDPYPDYEIIMTSTTPLQCGGPVSSETPLAQYEIDFFPSTTLMIGNYALSASGSFTPPAATMSYFSCSGGSSDACSSLAGNEDGDETGVVTITSGAVEADTTVGSGTVPSLVRGTFSVTWSDPVSESDTVTGSFCAPVCPN